MIAPVMGLSARTVYEISLEFDMARTGTTERSRTIAGMKKTIYWVLAVGLALAVGAAGVTHYGAMRWDDDTLARRARLAAGRAAVNPAAVDFRALNGLPAPVQRYFR